MLHRRGHGVVRESRPGRRRDLRRAVVGLLPVLSLAASDGAFGQAVTFQSFTEAKAGVDDTSITLDTPGGTVSGDLLIAAVVTDDDNGTSLAPPAGQGWTAIDVAAEGTAVTFGVWWKLAGASEPSTHTFTWSVVQQSYGWMMRFTGHHPSAPIHTSAATGGAATTSPTSPSVTTTVVNTLILRLGGFDDDDITLDSPGLSGHTAITMDDSGDGLETCSGGAGHAQQAAAGATGTADFTLTAPQEYRAVTIAIAPPACLGDPDCNDGNACTTDVCVTGTCQNNLVSAGTVCRASAGACDPQEVCDGVSVSCPSDARSASGTVCRGSLGACDPEEVCDGTSATCPTDVISSAGTVCRASTGGCDPQEVCDGASAVCPSDVISPSGTVCRASTGGCDPQEVCDGTSAACPNDVISASGTVCRASTGGCDPQEVCDGTSAACPNDVISPSGTVCRASLGGCDPQEVCDGTSATCPNDVISASGAVCRASAGICDPQEVCDGVSVACPTDARSASGTVCRASLGACDPQEVCDGTSATCPTDVISLAGTVCRASTGGCDPQEVCDGTAVVCPGDSISAAGTVCRASAGACDPQEVCDGASATCPADELALAGTVCRSAVDVCDAQETCDGASSACPGDALVTVGTVCRTSAGVCDPEEACTGSSSACPADLRSPSGTVCRSVAGACDVQESCDGVAATCPADVLVASGTECRASAGACDPSEACNGASAACPVDLLFTAGTVCRASTGFCDPQEVCDGAAAACPANSFLTNGTACNDGNACNVGETCQTGVCTGGAPPDCSGFGDQCNVASCNPSGSEGNCTIITPVTDGTGCDDGVACTSASCQGGTCIGTPSATVSVNIEAQGLTNAVTRNVTFVISTCGGSFDTRVVPISFDALGLGSTVLTGVDDAADWIAVREGHTLRRLSALSFLSCAASVNTTGAGHLTAGDFQTATVPQDNLVDITDFSILATRWNALVDANASTGADVNGDGVQATADFTALQVNFLQIGDAVDACAVSSRLPGGTRISGTAPARLGTFAAPKAAARTADLWMAGGVAADMDGDGTVDVSDIRAFARTHALPLLPEFEALADEIDSAKQSRPRR